MSNETIDDAERNLRAVLAGQFGSSEAAGPIADAIGSLIEAKMLQSQEKGPVPQPAGQEWSIEEILIRLKRGQFEPRLMLDAASVIERQRREIDNLKRAPSNVHGAGDLSGALAIAQGVIRRT